MKHTSLIVFLRLALLASASASGIAQSQVAPQEQRFFTLHIGAGGQLTNLDIQCDSTCTGGTGTATKVVRADAYGAYWYNPSKTNCGNANRTGCWQQLVTASGMPGGAHIYNGGSGVYEIVIAPSKTAHFYMYYSGDSCIYATTDHGQTWKKTGFACIPAAANTSPGWTKFFHPYMAVDPANENILYTGTPSSGVFYTTNGGITFTQIPTSTVAAGAVPAYGGQGGGNLIAFDPTSSVVGGVTQGVYISSYGTGVYHSTNGGGTGGNWTLTIGTPITHVAMVIDLSGKVWLADGSQTATNVYTYNGTSWDHISEAASGSWFVSIAVDPNNCSSAETCRVIMASDGGRIDITTNGGRSWTGPNSSFSRVATDIPWLANTNESYMNNGNMKFDPSQLNTLDFAEGIGFWQSNPPASAATAFNWTSFSADIEELVSNWAVSPPNGNPVLTFWDRPVFTSMSPTTYPTNHGVSYKDSIIMGWGVDYVSENPNIIVILANWGKDTSGISTDGGITWNKFGSVPTDILPAGASGPVAMLGGSIAASTPTNFLISVSSNGNLWYTKDAGKTWNVTIPPGVPRSTTIIANGSTPTSSTELHFASVPATVKLGQTVTDVKNYGVSGAKVVSITSTTVTISAPPTRTVYSGDAVLFQAETGWGWAYYNGRQTICADRVKVGTFYAYNYGPTLAPHVGGIWKSADGGASWSQAYSKAFPSSGVQARLECVPGNAGDMFFTSGSQSGSHPNHQPFYECQDTSSTILCRTISNVADVWAFGFGKAKAGRGGYPAIYIYGAVGGAMGYWRSTDHASTWTQLGPAFQKTLDAPTVIIGDSNIYGRFYVGFHGSGFIYGQFNYLLRRDFDPASNDNTPAYAKFIASQDVELPDSWAKIRASTIFADG